VNWNEDSAFFKQSNGGKPIGWTYEKIETDQGSSESNVIFYAIKATEVAIASSSADGAVDTSDWASSILQLFQKYLKKETADEMDSNDIALLKNLIIESDRE